jgi:hypothetical protein
LIIVGVIILAAALSAGSFYGGITYERSQTNNIRNQFLQSRGLSGGGFENNGGSTNGRQNGGFAGGQRGGFFGGSGVTGQVKSLDGNTLSLSTAQNVTTVNLTDSTVIEKPSQGTTSDLQAGVRVVVTGQADSNGVITASQITILNNNLPIPPTATAP